MTPTQLAVNSRALMAAADKLTRRGFDGDAYRFVENLIVNLLADGYRPVEPPVPARGPGASRAARKAALQAAEAAVRASKDARTGKRGGNETTGGGE